MAETVIFDDATKTVYSSDSGGVPGSRGYWTCERTVWKAGTPQANEIDLRSKVQAALAANVNDVAQDQTIQTQAATITAASVTNLATAATAIGKLAQAVSLLAGNDVNTKKELQAIAYMLLGKSDSTAGT